MKKWVVVQEFEDGPRCTICHYYKPKKDEAAWYYGICGVTGQPVKSPWECVDDCPLQEVKDEIPITSNGV
jgi:hypothetical protein